MEIASIRLDQFLKQVRAVGSGGEAKIRIQAGEVKVNGEVEKRRSHKLEPGEIVSMDGSTWTVPPLQTGSKDSLNK